MENEPIITNPEGKLTPEQLEARKQLGQEVVEASLKLKDEKGYLGRTKARAAKHGSLPGSTIDPKINIAFAKRKLSKAEKGLIKHQEKYDSGEGFTYKDEKNAVDSYSNYKKADHSLVTAKRNEDQWFKSSAPGVGRFEELEVKLAERKVKKAIENADKDFAKNGDTYHQMALVEDSLRPQTEAPKQEPEQAPIEESPYDEIIDMEKMNDKAKTLYRSAEDARQESNEESAARYPLRTILGKETPLERKARRKLERAQAAEAEASKFTDENLDKIDPAAQRWMEVELSKRDSKAA